MDYITSNGLCSHCKHHNCGYDKVFSDDENLTSIFNTGYCIEHNPDIAEVTKGNEEPENLEEIFTFMNELEKEYA